MRRHQRSPYGEQHRFYHAGGARPIRAPARRSPGVQNLRGPSSQPAEARAARFAHGARPHRGAGARPARARERHSLERPFGRSAARMAAHRARGFLRRGPHRHRSGGPVLPGNGRIGRPSAAARMRAALASETARAPARHPAHAAPRQLRAGLLSRPAQEKNPRRNRARARRVPARILSPAPPQSAQPALDEEEPLVRARSAAATAAKVQSRPYDIKSSEMKLIGSLASPYTRKVRIVLAEKKIDYDFEIDNPWKADAKAAKLNPLGKVPALLLDDGRTLFDSRVIVGFLDNASPIARLVPAENRERVEVRRWEALADIVVGVCLGWLDFRYPKMDWKQSHANLARAFAKLSERQSFADTVPKE